MAGQITSMSVLTTPEGLEKIVKICGINISNSKDKDKDEDEESSNPDESTPGEDTPKSDTSTPDPALKDAPVGSISDIKSLYQGKEDSRGRAQWLDKYPDDAEEAAENEMTAKYALIARKTKCFNGRKKFDIDSIIINSPALKSVLGTVFEKYPGVTCELDRLVFERPFEPFVHRWTEFKRAVEEEKDEKTREHLELLLGLLKEELKDTIKAVEDYFVHGVTTFEHLWAIFQPGAVVYTRAGGTPKAMEFSYGTYTKTQCGPAYQLCLEPVGWAGTEFGRESDYINIFSFVGTRPIKDLNALPLSFYPDKENIRETLIERGRKYEALAGYHYKAYDGVALSWNSKGQPVPITVGGRIIIDTDSFERFNPDRANDHDELKDADFTVSELPATNTDSVAQNTGNAYTDEAPEPKLSLTPEAHLICKATVPGYSLKLKKWLYFFVDNVSEISWNDNAFNTLVLPPDTKDLLMSFVESQVENKDSFDDVIQGKGKGIIMLLSGPPGVGKTLTAESVAESMHIPLYMMSAGDLGIRPDEVEDALQGILEMVAKWNAILLLDECDVFLEERTSHDLERNKLVSIFLRTLEYYEGILFLTTNRVSNMDAAFQSRIHVSMTYPDLTAESRRQIWRNFLQGKNEISEADLDVLKEIVLNGRQIKNVIKTAYLLSTRKKSPLTRENIETVLAIEGRRPGIGS